MSDDSKCGWLRKMADQYLADAKRVGDMDAYTDAARFRDEAARYKQAADEIDRLRTRAAELEKMLREARERAAYGRPVCQVISEFLADDWKYPFEEEGVDDE